MGLLTILKKQRLKDREMRVLLLGLDNAGKTTIVKSILHEDMDQVSPTVGFSIRSIDYNGYTVNIWDVGGQETLRPFWRNYFEKTDCLIWVVDASALDRLDDCKRELENTLDEDRLAGAGLLVWVNKLDTVSSQEEDIVNQVAERLEIEKIKNHTVKIMGCSAKTGHNLRQGLDYVVNEVKDRLYALD